uniref:Uncharacterized protein n=1 Tax=Anguilla anguilla TaxID=7936 RepID=A0A0E9TVJ7_ANGAN
MCLTQGPKSGVSNAVQKGPVRVQVFDVVQRYII